jgi:hypothetical protein
MAAVVPLPSRGSWLPDARGDSRALRVSWHGDEGCAVLSVWRDGTCAATARLAAPEVATLVAALAEGLADGVVAALPDGLDLCTGRGLTAGP